LKEILLAIELIYKVNGKAIFKKITEEHEADLSEMVHTLKHKAKIKSTDLKVITVYTLSNENLWKQYMLISRPNITIKMSILSWKWWCTLTTPVIREAEVG
jgi:hypothetical protein